MFGKIHLRSHAIQGFSVLAVFFITASILLLSVYSGFLLLLDSVLEDYMFLEICPFHSGFQIAWHIVVHSNFLQSLVFLWYQLLLLSFISFLYLGPLSPFLDESG